ncbi:SPOR domain-containing protein [Halopseudomonas pelagia]|mgnify:CR=1 FL=1|uniref:SPOR domain-containing protein n=1 Tax=Halopseudomonas pelagia TaxID=553151 RepID=UPI0003B72E00|nr:SPOR domain-containing protein [Halopseudomonas pelagia]
MRSLFLFLVLLNVLYGLWQLQDGRADQSLYESADQALERLPAVEPPADRLEAAADPVERPPATMLCVNLGVFSVRSEAEQLRQRLLALSIESSVISRDIADSQDYWLVMPVQGGQPDAMQRLSQLQDAGIDSFIITRGPLANNLSLGVFSREDYALARQAQLEALGYVTWVERQDKLSSEYLVQVGSAARRLVDQSLLAKLRESFPGLQHQFLPCKPVAG